MVLSPSVLSVPVSEKEGILVAVSGGLDSVTLLHLLHLRGAKIGVAHCNFGLRGADSDNDEAFVKELAEKYGVPFYCNHFQTLQHAETYGLSIQMAARELRYKWFEEIKRKHKYAAIATAHHLNDSIETALLNLIRGTGPAGLRGISNNAGEIIRPLINFSRDEIMEYARKEQLKWRDDKSNESDYYKRNFLRHKVVPLLQQLNPNLLQTMNQSMQRMSDAAEIIEDRAEEIRETAQSDLEEKIWIKTGLLPKKGLPLLLHELLKPFNFTYLQACDISKRINGDSGKQFSSPTHRLLIDRQQLIITPLAEEQATVIKDIKIGADTDSVSVTNCHIVINRIPPAEFEMRKVNEVAAFDADKLQFPLVLRKWETGDKFQPFGMRGQKNVSDFLIDHKIPVTEKENTWVLLSGNDIAWLVGHRISEKFKVTARTKNIVELELLKK